MFVVTANISGHPQTFGLFGSKKKGETYLRKAGWRRLKVEDIRKFNPSFQGKYWHGLQVSEWWIKEPDKNPWWIGLVSEVLTPPNPTGA